MGRHGGNADLEVEEERVPYARVKEGRSLFVVASVVVVVVVLC